MDHRSEGTRAILEPLVDVGMALEWRELLDEGLDLDLELWWPWRWW